MTVLQVCAYAAPYEGNFIKSLKALGADLKKQNINMIYAFPESAKALDWVQTLAQETTVYFLPLSKARILPQTYTALAGIYRKHPDITIVHSHFELYDVPTVLTAPRHVKVFWHLHDALEMYNSIRNKIVHRVQYGMLHRSATLLSVSQKHMAYVLRCGFPSNQALFLPNGLDTDRIKRVNDRSMDKKYDFLIFGWEFERKGVDLCIEAVQKHSIDCRIAVVGTSNTEEIIRSQFGNPPQIEVIQPVHDINALYAMTKCFLHISRAEGLSYALLEAVYAGLPVICSNIPENSFAVQFPTVTMIQSGDVDAIAEAMKKRLSDSNVCRDAVDIARGIIEEKYSVNCWVKSVLKQYGITHDECMHF